METIKTKLFLVNDKEGRLTLVEVVDNSRVDAVIECEDLDDALKNAKLYRDGVKSGLTLDRSHVHVHITIRYKKDKDLLLPLGYKEVDENTGENFIAQLREYAA